MEDVRIYITRVAFRDTPWKAELCFFRLTSVDEGWKETGSFFKHGSTPQEALDNLFHFFGGKWPQKVEEVITPAQIARHIKHFNPPYN